MKSPIFVALAMLEVSTACSSKPAAISPVAFSDVNAPTKARNTGAEDDSRRSNVMIAEDIRKACGIEASEAFFTYDSSRVRSTDRAILKRLADCFTNGPLKGREMRLAGHADPRGDEEYNYVLGQRRADSVRSAIVDVGMPEEKVTTTSRGEIEAIGSDESGWARDRRVDIVLGV